MKTLGAKGILLGIALLVLATLSTVMVFSLRGNQSNSATQASSSAP